GPRYRDGLPELRPVPTHERVRQHRIRLEAAWHAKAGDRPPRDRGRGHARDRSAAQAKAQGALGWAAPTCRGGTSDRARAIGVPHGRAALQPRREAEDPDARDVAEAAS